MLHHLARFLQRVFAIVYAPQPGLRTFLTRGQTQESPLAQVTVAVLSAQESQRLFGVPLACRSIQPVFLRIVNRHSTPLRLYLLDIDPHYYTPLEAAGINHFSVLNRLSAFGSPFVAVQSNRQFDAGTSTASDLRSLNCYKSLDGKDLQLFCEKSCSWRFLGK